MFQEHVYKMLGSIEIRLMVYIRYISSLGVY